MPANILTMQEVVDEVMQEAGESEDELQMDACLDDVDGIPLTALEKNPLDPSNFDTLVCQSESPARLTTNSPEMPSASSSRPEQSLDDMIAEIECLVGSVCVLHFLCTACCDPCLLDYPCYCRRKLDEKRENAKKAKQATLPNMFHAGFPLQHGNQSCIITSVTAPVASGCLEGCFGAIIVLGFWHGGCRETNF